MLPLNLSTVFKITSILTEDYNSCSQVKILKTLETSAII